MLPEGKKFGIHQTTGTILRIFQQDTGRRRRFLRHLLKNRFGDILFYIAQDIHPVITGQLFNNGRRIHRFDILNQIRDLCRRQILQQFRRIIRADLPQKSETVVFGQNRNSPSRFGRGQLV